MEVNFLTNESTFKEVEFWVNYEFKLYHVSLIIKNLNASRTVITLWSFIVDQLGY